jgi:hypothetical protein
MRADVLLRCFGPDLTPPDKACLISGKHSKKLIDDLHFISLFEYCLNSNPILNPLLAFSFLLHETQATRIIEPSIHDFCIHQMTTSNQNKELLAL